MTSQLFTEKGLYVYLFKNFVVCEYYLWIRIYSNEFINNFAPENRW